MSSLSNCLDASPGGFRVGEKQVYKQDDQLSWFVCPGLRGFLERGTFSVETKEVLGKQDDLITPDINQEFSAEGVYWTPMWSYQTQFEIQV